MYDGMPDFDTRILEKLRQNRFFRLAPAAEIDAAYHASADIERLLATWRETADPTRATLPAYNKSYFSKAHLAPNLVNGLAFIVTTRAAVEGGKRFRQRLRPEVREALERDFPWLENRHQHVPAGWAPACEFPSAIDPFFNDASVEDAKARWQLVAAFNEVMAAASSRYLKNLLALPVLERQAEREEALARNYFAHWSPPATRELWRQCIVVIDAINAAVFETICDTQLKPILAYTFFKAPLHSREWKKFLTAVNEPQWLLPVSKAG
jgi:hypothetical protein